MPDSSERFCLTNVKTDPELLRLIKESKEKYDSMSFEDRKKMIEQQKESFVRGEMGMSELDKMIYEKSITAMEVLNDKNLEEKLERLQDATENILIAYAMGWDLDGVMDEAIDALNASGRGLTPAKFSERRNED